MSSKTNYYDEFISHKKKNYNEDAKNLIDSDDYLNDFLYEKYHYPRSNFITKKYDLNYNIIRDFPKKKILRWLEVTFKSPRIRYDDTTELHLELIKFIFYIWDKNDDEDYVLYIQKIKSHLIELVNMSANEYNDIITDIENPKYSIKNYFYNKFWLYSCCVLMDNCEDLIIKLIDIIDLKDSEYDLLYGLEQIDIGRLFILCKKIMLVIKQQNNFDREPCFEIENSSGFSNLLLKLCKNGYDVINDQQFIDIFTIPCSNGSTFENILVQLQNKIKNNSEIKKWSSKFIEEISAYLRTVENDKIILEKKTKILEILDINQIIQIATAYMKNEKNTIIKYYKSCLFEKYCIRKKNNILLHINLVSNPQNNSYTIQESLFLMFTTFHSDKNEKIGGLVFARRNYDININNIANKNETQWVLAPIITNKSDHHYCDVCANFITPRDFRCIVCKDFDICVDCKIVFEQNLNMQKNIFNETGHRIEHQITTLYLGVLNFNYYDTFLCFGNFFSIHEL